MTHFDLPNYRNIKGTSKRQVFYCEFSKLRLTNLENTLGIRDAYEKNGDKEKNIHDYLDTVAIDEGLTNLNWKYTLKQAGLKKYDSKSVVKNINLIIAKTDESEAK